jgi:hypothetical protein
MIPTEYDVQHVYDQQPERRREVARHRLVQASRIAGVAQPSLLTDLYELLSRLHLVRPIAGQAKAPA